MPLSSVVRNRVLLPALACAVLCLRVAAQHKLALPGYRFEFPRDHFAHPEYQTEWWYYTGNLTGTDNRHFGFEVTFFRFQPDRIGTNRVPNKTWDPSQVYIAHFAVTDIDRGNFYHEERLNRHGPSLAGVDAGTRSIWNGNWQATFAAVDPIKQHLEAVSNQARISLTLESRKPPVINGENGVSRKGPKPGQSSHYYSLTRLDAAGELSVGGKNCSVVGHAWMDHEFFSEVDDRDTAGWDWMCIQLNTDEELMLYRLRQSDGGNSPYSSGTFTDRNGHATFLSQKEFSLRPGRTWKSSATGGEYPVEWDIEVPSKNLKLYLTPALDAQELVNRITRDYWEGSVRFSGTEGSAKIAGQGYLEMTGYTLRKNEKGFGGKAER